MDQRSLRTNVDLMILDYLLALSISGMVAIINKEKTPDEVNWLVEAAQNFCGLIAVHQVESPLPWDLDIKIRIFHLVNLFRAWEPPKDRTLDTFVPLSEVAMQFMDLCQQASETVSWNRWFDLGARFMTHAILEESTRLPEPLDRLRQWETKNNLIDAHWEVSRTFFLGHIPPPYGTAGPATREELDGLFPLSELESEFTGFVDDFMDVLDAPLLLQLEQGHLEGLTREDTCRIRDHCTRTL
ncbi:unnamed protein product [Penicillium salamii]|uniref:Uncharacterized protein n=1 Tax=Penicillium salamii TaxID=1612424 RepID=A0A9W4NB51_9EURO|nr:unnamed protein product [Penicillium salamii]CAG8049882.1 unnamed protein product [Penicillium salamii]CAG8062147.1 unnamed protein product [Penicillium salamii]CAG8230044.1 unnamed protein product [Penicillium salamii]CAG8301895.1 unnamed protein product [Penicillium salamii]